MSECLFCKIQAGEIPANKVYEDEQTLAFHDIEPAAPIHVLVIPRAHYSAVHETPDDDHETMGRVMTTVTKVVEKLGLKEKGYRLVINSGKDAGQAVPHIHVHVLSGRKMKWPPG